MLRSLLSMEGQRALGIHQKYLNLCSEDERRSYGFGKTSTQFWSPTLKNPNARLSEVFGSLRPTEWTVIKAVSESRYDHSVSLASILNRQNSPWTERTGIIAFIRVDNNSCFGAADNGY